MKRCQGLGSADETHLARAKNAWCMAQHGRKKGPHWSTSSHGGYSPVTLRSQPRGSCHIGHTRKQGAAASQVGPNSSWYRTLTVGPQDHFWPRDIADPLLQVGVLCPWTRFPSADKFGCFLFVREFCWQIQKTMSVFRPRYGCDRVQGPSMKMHSGGWRRLTLHENSQGFQWFSPAQHEFFTALASQKPRKRLYSGKIPESSCGHRKAATGSHRLRKAKHQPPHWKDRYPQHKLKQNTNHINFVSKV